MSIIINITFKDEEELDSEPIGPVTLTLADGKYVPCGWLKLSQAEQFADNSGLILERG